MLRQAAEGRRLLWQTKEEVRPAHTAGAPGVTGAEGGAASALEAGHVHD